ncbi:hypothetical protein, partial [Petrachloros mirabilis]
MTTGVNFHEYQFSFHGHGLCYKTSSRTLLPSVAAWAHEFRQAELSGEVSLTITFEEVSSRDAVPLVKSPSSRLLFSGTKPALGSSMRALWQCDVIQDEGRLVVDV